MSRAHRLHGLAFAAIWGAPKRPLVTGADGVHRVPEFGGDSGIRWILEHASQLAAFDLPANLAAKLEVITLVVNGPGSVRLHENAVISAGDELIKGQRLFSRQDADIGHADEWNPVPALGAHGAVGARLADGMRC